MAVGESELAGDRCTVVHGESDNNEEVNKGRNALLGQEKDAIFFSQDPELFYGSDSTSLFSSEDFIEVDVRYAPIDKEQGEVDPTNGTPPMPIPTAQMMERDGRIPLDVFATSESSAAAGWSAFSTESLFSIRHGDSSLGRDQTLMLESEMSAPEEPNKPSDLPFSPPPASVEPSHDKNTSQVKISGKNKLPQDKTKQCAGKEKRPNESVKPSASHRSTGSESSTYSFAFPVLVPEVQQNGTPKEGASDRQKKNPNMGEENSISRPTQPEPSKKKSCWSCCISFRSCFPCSSCRPSH